MSNQVQSSDATVMQFSNAPEVARNDLTEPESPVPDERTLELVFSGAVAA